MTEEFVASQSPILKRVVKIRGSGSKTIIPQSSTKIFSIAERNAYLPGQAHRQALATAARQAPPAAAV